MLFGSMAERLPFAEGFELFKSARSFVANGSPPLQHLQYASGFVSAVRTLTAILTQFDLMFSILRSLSKHIHAFDFELHVF